MPSKPHRGRNKSSSPAKKRKNRQASSVRATQHQIIPHTSEPASQPITPTPPPNALDHSEKVDTILYPYITTELRRIGILAGVILAILIVLSLFLT